MSNQTNMIPQPCSEQEQTAWRDRQTNLEEPLPRLKERYQIVHYLSRGSFGQTFVAQDLQRPGQPQCVVKQFHPAQLSSDLALAGARQRFDQEAAVLETLGHHAQIPRLLAHFDADGEFYLVQELIAGPSLQQLLTEQPRWSVELAAQLLREILEILTFVHGQGVIHRDIKPDNLILRQTDNRWVLIDFGAVKQLTTTPSPPDLGPGTMAIYSEGYTPSEQFEGHPQPASDLYALGMVVLQCLTGQHPNDFRPDLRDLGPTWLTPLVGGSTLTAILEKMTHTHWQDRYQSAQVALDEVRAIALPNASGQPSQTVATTTATSPTKPAKKAPTATVICPPPSPPEVPKLAFPTEVLLPQRSSATPSYPLPVNAIASSAEPTNDTQPSLWSKLPISHVQGTIWRWFNAHNICRAQDAIAFFLCVGVLLGVASTMTWWVVAAISQPRSREASPAQPDAAAPLVATLLSGADIHQISFTPDSTKLFSADASGNIKAWDVASQQPIQSLKSFGAITALAMTADGTRLATGDEYANVNLWDLRTGKLLHTLRDHKSAILSLSFNPTDSSLIGSSDDPQLITWDLKTSNFGKRLTETSAPITSTAVSPSGDHLIGGSTDFSLKVWNARSGELLHNLTGHSGAIQTVAISPNGAVMASGSSDRTVRIWNLYTGELITTLAEHYGAVSAIAFSPNSQIVASGSDDGTIRLWHIYSGELVQKFSNFQGPVSDLTISANGELLASSTAKGTIEIWQLDQETTP
ncbi:hypothetical protein C7293_17075 [filamentous cyanobacterium CCT1]|nr:hypothetical protein C7293_17075 [filamentous cyanobacterium CCT1]PSN79877.1 hypothetical protein C8B47_09415 [filamentous cyanobacterium CCP4]